MSQRLALHCEKIMPTDQLVRSVTFIFNTLTAAIVYTASAQPARHGNTSRPKKLR